jgi:hypothetical protein
MEGHAKAGGKEVRVQKQHADGKEEESSPNNQLTGVVMHCNEGFGGNQVGF